MEAKFARLRSNFIIIMISIGLVIAGQAWAQNSTLIFEKATLVSKFAKFVSWPDDAIKTKFVIGVYKDAEKYKYFSEFFANKGVKGKDISVRLVESFNEAKDVNIFYVSSTKRNLLELADKSLRSLPVLVITEGHKDLNRTMINLSFDKEQGKLVFTVNDFTINAKRLNFPDLSVFSEGKSNEEVLPPGPTFAEKQQQEEELKALQNLLALQNQIAEQKDKLAQLNNKLQLSEENSKKYNQALQETSESLTIAQEDNAQKTQEINAQEKKLRGLELQLAELRKQLKMKKEEWQIAEADKATDQEKLVVELTEQLEKQKKLTESNIAKVATINNKLASASEENKALSSFQTLFYVFVIIAIIALIVAFLMWKKAKDAASQPSVQVKGEDNALLPFREEQLIKSENYAALGYIATDITYAVGLSLSDFQEQLEAASDKSNAETLKPVVALLENFNIIAADQDDTDIQSFDVIAYMQKMLMLYEFEFNQSDIAYNYSGEKTLTIKSVPSYIAIILLNVINNSLKHGFDNNGNGKITLKAEKGAKGGVKITYTDDGKGMSKSDLAQVFTPFFTTRSDRGYVGVGMSTTYDIIKNKLSGDIKIESQVGKGTTVIITLP
ncbi:YfiR/HmsC family protein [Thalassotalea piscium]